ncbi:MAG: RsmB/NOP family class I SAM-dependent RNA methyltransferase, partial [Lachnospiraceae bacterium]|nr:RsmB/NOP family class I SAM-dependent RNA methyltransferase [Lachnospiraceae bacterium]
MNNLPKEFLERMQQMLGDQYLAFLASYDRPTRAGLRVNMLKKRPEDDARKDSAEAVLPAALFGTDPVPWAPNGYYCEPKTRPGKHPFHEAGVYYMQEPSAMAVAALSGIKPGMRVLDLCAAPGGKSTQIASMLQGEGVLYSNEIHPARARILSQNIERMGIANAIVMNEEPGRLASRFPLYFDTVVVDAPCSGEGMFRKEEEAIPNWSPENVRMCAQRQSGILDCAAEMTAAGGA